MLSAFSVFVYRLKLQKSLSVSNSKRRNIQGFCFRNFSRRRNKIAKTIKSFFLSSQKEQQESEKTFIIFLCVKKFLSNSEHFSCLSETEK